MKRILLLIIISTLIYGAFVFQRNLSKQNTITASHADQPKINSEMDVDMLREVTGIISVEANNQTISPNTFEVGHTKTIMIDVLAIDQNYTFNMNDFNIHETIVKGQTKQIKVSGMGVGRYDIDCGPGCSGTVNVKNLSDEDDDVR